MTKLFYHPQGLTRGDGSDPDAEVFPEQRVIRVDGSREKQKEQSSSSSRKRRNESGDYEKAGGRDRRGGEDNAGRGRVSSTKHCDLALSRKTWLLLSLLIEIGMMIVCSLFNPGM